MSRRRIEITDSANLLDALAVVVVWIFGSVGGNYGNGMLCSCVAAGSLGVWRLVKLLAAIVQRMDALIEARSDE